jgi:hypothetical protein
MQWSRRQVSVEFLCAKREANCRALCEKLNECEFRSEVISSKKSLLPEWQKQDLPHMLEVRETIRQARSV